MPNWCENEVTFSGNEEKVQKIKDFVKGKESDFCFEEIVPMPKQIKDTTAPSNLSPEESKKLKDLYGFDNWYDWCNENWDTKWNASDVEMEDQDDRVIYYFLTAWCPPSGIYAKLCQLFKIDEDEDIHCSWFYREEGMEFAGYLNQE
jgi:hypothetical protein